MGQQHDPKAAIDLLRGTVQYDFAFTQSFDYLYPAYIRGQAYMELGDSRSAAVEFQSCSTIPVCAGNISPAHWPGFNSAGRRN